jgi:hypothetical protein
MSSASSSRSRLRTLSELAEIARLGRADDARDVRPLPLISAELAVVAWRGLQAQQPSALVQPAHEVGREEGCRSGRAETTSAHRARLRARSPRRPAESRAEAISGGVNPRRSLSDRDQPPRADPRRSPSPAPGRTRGTAGRGHANTATTTPSTCGLDRRVHDRKHPACGMRSPINYELTLPADRSRTGSRWCETRPSAQSMAPVSTGRGGQKGRCWSRRWRTSPI